MNKTFAKLIWLIISLPAIYLLIVWTGINEPVPLHFSLDGTVDRFGSKYELLFVTLILTVINAGVYLMMINAHRIDPKKNSIENKPRMDKIAFAVSAFVAMTGVLPVYTAVQGKMNFGANFILAGVGLLFTIIGNYMFTLKPNYFAGVRVPWTLENEDNWKRTHALSGKLWFFSGLVITVVCLLLKPAAALVFFLVAVGLMSLIPVIYSFLLYRQQKNKIN